MEGTPGKKDLIQHLQNRKIFDHPVTGFRVIETHISWVLLTGPYAYKIKKPVKFDFVDFSTLEKRKYFCEQELRLNKRLSGFLYIGMVAITGSPISPELHGSGPVIEYAIKMMQFEQKKLFSHLAFLGELSRLHMEKLASKIGHFHLKEESLPLNSHYGSTDSIFVAMMDNFKDCRARTQAKPLLKKLTLIETTSLQAFEQLKPLFQERKRQGFIKECHGDLHLGNIVLLHNMPLVFDCIEFNPDFRNIDVISEIAFLTMDLKDKNLKALANHFLNEVLTITGDYEALPLLQFYELYRAMVRAKIALYANTKDSRAIFKKYLSLAATILKEKIKEPLLLINVGVSGSGKTSTSSLLAESLPAIHIRSDIERKRLYPNLSGPALYTRDISQQTYDRLLNLAKSLLKSGYSVIVDATFLEYGSRTVFRRQAENLSLPFLFLQYEAPEKELKKRVVKRLQSKKDSSDATVAVLEKQLQNREALRPEELEHCMKIDTSREISINSLVRKIRRKINKNNANV